ncbi:hypothetical protein P692DRAFT_20842111 [Suillus brevipes Sb2]|nr:hypothetical protein P692DRAFT_20842111 [Suillus brevipes Sb2]
MIQACDATNQMPQNGPFPIRVIGEIVMPRARPAWPKRVYTLVSVQSRRVSLRTMFYR